MPSCRVFLVFILLLTLYESVDSKLSRHKGTYLCKSWKSCPLQIPLKKCSKHMSVGLEKICDGKPHCPCGDDEEKCDPNCPSQLRCRNKTCLSASKVCDGAPDCLEHEDEMMCPKPVTMMSPKLVTMMTPKPVTMMTPKPESLCPGMFACLNRTCIPANRACDNIPDCEQNEDELSCTAAPLCRTCDYFEQCYQPLPTDVSENLFLSTTLLSRVIGTRGAILNCNVLCTLNMDCKSTWTIVIDGELELECRLSDMLARDVAMAAGVNIIIGECQGDKSLTYTKTACLDHAAPQRRHHNNGGGGGGGF